jgi:hypothetical protein
VAGIKEQLANASLTDQERDGMVFEIQSNGCQVLPEMNPTVTVSSGSMTTTHKFVEALLNARYRESKGNEVNIPFKLEVG